MRIRRKKNLGPELLRIRIGRKIFLAQNKKELELVRIKKGKKKKKKNPGPELARIRIFGLVTGLSND